MNRDRFGRAWDGMVGVYDLPFLLPKHADHMLLIDSRQTLKIQVWVNNPAGANRLRLVESYYTDGPLDIKK